MDAYDYNITTGAASKVQQVVTFDRESEGIPDGMCIDADGNLYVAMFFGGQVIKINPETGNLTYYNFLGPLNHCTQERSCKLLKLRIVPKQHLYVLVGRPTRISM